MPALEVLCERGLILPGSLVAPGHSGDVHAGSHLTDTLMNGPISEQGLHHAILTKYFRFNENERRAQLDSGVMAERIRASTRVEEPWSREVLAMPWNGGVGVSGTQNSFRTQSGI